MKYLFVVAHPDDEVLGAGGMIYDLIKKNYKVSVCFMCSDAEARSNVTKGSSIRQQAKDSLNKLGLSEENMIFGEFPNIKMNVIEHIEIVKFIEEALRITMPDVVVTHYKNDLNIDHRITSECCDEAIRLFQRNDSEKEIRRYMYMEVLSSTDWVNNDAFVPNYFYEIKEIGVKAKIEALSRYEAALRLYPHPRSKESITALATYRGSQSKLKYAEAFMTVFERVPNA